MEHAHLVRCKRSNDRMKHATIVEKGEVVRAPIDGEDELPSPALAHSPAKGVLVLTFGAIPGL